MTFIARLFVAALAGLLGGCLLVACAPSAPIVGYDGPVPSPQAQGVLGDVRDHVFLAPSGPLAGRSLRVVGFAVIPNPVTGKGPVVALAPAESDPDALGATDEYLYVPVSTDADAVHFAAWVRAGRAPADDSGLSAAYCEALGLDG